jgi:hypothetical protein
MTEPEWPELREALMRLVAAVIMYPEDAVTTFVERCRDHKDEIDAVTGTGGGSFS